MTERTAILIKKLQPGYVACEVADELQGALVIAGFSTLDDFTRWLREQFGEVDIRAMAARHGASHTLRPDDGGKMEAAATAIRDEWPNGGAAVAAGAGHEEWLLATLRIMATARLRSGDKPTDPFQAKLYRMSELSGVDYDDVRAVLAGLRGKRLIAYSEPLAASGDWTLRVLDAGWADNLPWARDRCAARLEPQEHSEIGGGDAGDREGGQAATGARPGDEASGVADAAFPERAEPAAQEPQVEAPPSEPAAGADDRGGDAPAADKQGEAEAPPAGVTQLTRNERKLLDTLKANAPGVGVSFPMKLLVLSEKANVPADRIAFGLSALVDQGLVEWTKGLPAGGRSRFIVTAKGFDA